MALFLLYVTVHPIYGTSSLTSRICSLDANHLHLGANGLHIGRHAREHAAAAAAHEDGVDLLALQRLHR